MKKPINIFFVGKGGVGKSTSAALNAVFLAQKGFRVLIVSLDPAHNQSDIFQMKFSDKALKIASDISAIEVDQDKWIKAYLKDIRNQIKKTYSYLTAFNLENYFKVIKHSPGLEEYALILAFKHIYQEFSYFDYLVFDMPPTALALKFFSLPSLSLIWIEQLVSLRQEIIKKKDLVTKIKFGQKEFERDKVLNKINVLRNDFQTLKDVFEMAIAVAPVSSYRFYDSIYTELYMGMPQDNADGYDNNSLLTHVDKLKGKLLLIHGTGDDNVHFQNSIELSRKLTEANKQFEMQFYIDKAHSIRGNKTRLHLYTRMTDFILENL